MYYRFGKAFYFVSVFLFIFFLLYFYSALGDQVAYQFDSLDNRRAVIGKNEFFYGMILLFLVINGLILLPPKLLETKSHKKLHRIFPVGDEYRDYFLSWFYSFGGVVNLSLSLLVFYIHSINNQEVISTHEFSFFFYLMPVLLLLWIVVLFLLFAGKATQLRKQG